MQGPMDGRISPNYKMGYMDPRTVESVQIFNRDQRTADLVLILKGKVKDPRTTDLVLIFKGESRDQRTAESVRDLDGDTWTHG